MSTVGTTVGAVGGATVSVPAELTIVNISGLVPTAGAIPTSWRLSADIRLSRCPALAASCSFFAGALKQARPSAQTSAPGIRSRPFWLRGRRTPVCVIASATSVMCLGATPDDSRNHSSSRTARRAASMPSTRSTARASPIRHVRQSISSSRPSVMRSRSASADADASSAAAMITRTDWQLSTSTRSARAFHRNLCKF